jgi:pimeloyl-ACP methyl ester carboxylesterase
MRPHKTPTICQKYGTEGPTHQSHEFDGEKKMNKLTTASGGVPHKKSRIAWIALAAMGAAFAVVRSKTRQVEREHPPTGKFLEVDGVRLHYLEQGEGPALVLLHGNNTMAEDFRLSGLMDQLARNFRVIAFDRPGYGYTERPRDRGISWTPQAQASLLQKALQQLGIEQSLVVAHSWATLVGVAMGLAYPQQVKGLLLLAGYYYPSVRLDVPVAAMPAIPVIGDAMRYTTSPLVGRLVWPIAVKSAFSPSEVPESFRRFPVWMTLRPSQLRACSAEAALMVPAAEELQHQYTQLSMPVTLMAGEGDVIADPEHNSVRLHQELKHSELRLLPGMGHMLQHLAQDDIAREASHLGELAGMLSHTGPDSVAARFGASVQRDQARAGGFQAGSPT